MIDRLRQLVDKLTRPTHTHASAGGDGRRYLMSDAAAAMRLTLDSSDRRGGNAGTSRYYQSPLLARGDRCYLSAPLTCGGGNSSAVR